MISFTPDPGSTERNTYVFLCIAIQQILVFFGNGFVRFSVLQNKKRSIDRGTAALCPLW